MAVKAVALVLFAPAFAVLFGWLYRGLIGRRPGHREWTRFLAAEVVLLLILSVVPNLVFAAFSLACAVLALGLSMFCLIVQAVRRVQIGRWRARARATVSADPAELFPLEGPLSPWLSTQATELEASGFRRTEQGIDRDSWTYLILFRESDSVAAEVGMPPLDDRRFDATKHRVVELTSILEGHAGALCTNSRMALGPSYWRGELRQHFPGAAAPVLVNEHERAVRLLEERGITVERYPIERLHQERSWGLRMMAAALASTSNRAIVSQFTPDAQSQRWLFGRLEDDPNLWQRLQDLPPPQSTVAH